MITNEFLRLHNLPCRWDNLHNNEIFLACTWQAHHQADQKPAGLHDPWRLRPENLGLFCMGSISFQSTSLPMNLQSHKDVKHTKKKTNLHTETTQSSKYDIKRVKRILRLWFHASLIYINYYPTICNTKQSIHYSACFGCQTHPSSRVHKTVTTASGSGHIFCAATSPQHGQIFFCAATSLQRWREVAAQHSMTSTGGCIYSFVYSWWVWLTPETCRVNSQNNKWTAFCCISLDNY